MNKSLVAFLIVSSLVMFVVVGLQFSLPKDGFYAVWGWELWVWELFSGLSMGLTLAHWIWHLMQVKPKK